MKVSLGNFKGNALCRQLKEKVVVSMDGILANSMEAFNLRFDRSGSGDASGCYGTLEVSTVVLANHCFDLNSGFEEGRIVFVRGIQGKAQAGWR